MEELTGPVLSTVTFTAVEVARFPALSRATARRVWAPSATAVLFQETPYALVVSSAPMFVLVSSLNWTPATASSSEAVAVRLREAPETVAPLVGAVMETVGAEASAATENEIV